MTQFGLWEDSVDVGHGGDPRRLVGSQSRWACGGGGAVDCRGHHSARYLKGVARNGPVAAARENVGYWFGVAASLIGERLASGRHQLKRDVLERTLGDALDGVVFHGAGVNRLGGPQFWGLGHRRDVTQALDLEGIQISTGSACSLVQRTLDVTCAGDEPGGRARGAPTTGTRTRTMT